MPTVSHYLVVDLEATCDEPASFPRSEMEIIEIGAVLVDKSTLTPVSEFQTFVRPVRHRRLTTFCTQLTTITQADVDGAPTFPLALKALKDFIQGTESRLCSWGAYDDRQLQQDAAFHRQHLPFRYRHFNLKRAFSDALNTKRRFGMRGALKRVGLPLEGTHHRGIDDARNIAKLLPYILEEKPIPAPGGQRGSHHRQGRRASKTDRTAW